VFGEANDMLPPLLDALSYLHSNGFVHGRIKPSNVLAVGDQLKLSTDQVTSSNEVDTERRRRDAYDAPETAAGIVSPAGDVWSVGVTLVAALTQNVTFAEEGAQKDPGLLDTLPQPFRGIAKECLHLDPKRRCSIAEIQRRLQPAARSVPAQTPAPAISPRPLKRGPIAAGLLLAAVLAGVIVFFARGRSVTAPPSSAAVQPAPVAASTPKPNPAVRQSGATPRKTVATEGAVVHQVIPDVSSRSRNTITGTIKVGVRVEVDSSGKVTAARLKSAGPSKYFAGLALKAAERWQFSPTQAGGAGPWLIQFRFRRSGTEASAERTR
jgi:TonB family protein